MLSCFSSVLFLCNFVFIPDFWTFNLIWPLLCLFYLFTPSPQGPRASFPAFLVHTSAPDISVSSSPLCDTSSKTSTKHLFNRMRVDNFRRPCVSVCIRVCLCITSFYVGGCGAAAGFGSKTKVCWSGLSIVPQTSCLLSNSTRSLILVGSTHNLLCTQGLTFLAKLDHFDLVCVQ